MSALWSDIKFGFRMLAKKPGFSMLVVLSLGLSIAANTTIFSFINELLFRPAPVEDPGNLWQVWSYRPERDWEMKRYGTLSYPGYTYYRDNNRSFDALAAFVPAAEFVSWNRNGVGESIQCQFVSGNFFDVCGTRMALGRAFAADEARTPGLHPVAVLSHRFWKNNLDADREVVGKELTVNGVSLTVVGVAPAVFSGVMAGIAPDCWSTFMMAPSILHDQEWLTRQSSFNLVGLGRLRADITVPQAKADLIALTRQLEEQQPDRYKDLDATVIPASMVPTPLRGYVRMFTALLMGAVVMVLLIACANAAHLLFARAVARRHEIAARISLGATRSRLIRQLLTESIILAVLSGGVGLVLTFWLIPVLLRLSPSALPVRFNVHVDLWVLSFTVLLSMLTGILFGLTPAWHSTRENLSSMLKSDSRTSAVRRSRFAGMLIIGQVAVCFVLLIAGTLCIRSLFNAQSIDVGFKAADRVVAEINLDSFGYPAERANGFYQQLQERVSALPSVESLASISFLPLGTRMHSGNITIDGDEPLPERSGILVQMYDVSPGYFSTMGTALLQGREFTEGDRADNSNVVIINEEMVQNRWQGQNPIGNRIRSEDGTSYEIIGVVQTGKYRHLGEDRKAAVFFPMPKSRLQQTLVARVRADSGAALSAIRNIVRELDPRLAPTQLGTLDEHLSLTLFPVRATGFLLGAFGLAALLLAMSGLFGVIAYSVSQRTREIGIRVALGAQYRDVLHQVMRQGVVLVSIGLVVGIGGALVTSQFLRGFLLGISSTDAVTFAVVTMLLSVVAFFACYIPAHRAAKTDPITALRSE